MKQNLCQKIKTLITDSLISSFNPCGVNTLVWTQRTGLYFVFFLEDSSALHIAEISRWDSTNIDRYMDSV